MFVSKFHQELSRRQHSNSETPILLGEIFHVIGRQDIRIGTAGGGNWPFTRCAWRARSMFHGNGKPIEAGALDPCRELRRKGLRTAQLVDAGRIDAGRAQRFPPA